MYCKLFASLYQGTLRGRSNEILVFTNLLAHAGRDGTVDKHFRAIAEETGLSIDDVREAVTVLESPDPESRSPDENGARIVRLDEHRVWGWRIVNYGKYRAIRSEEDRAEQNRLAQERWRNKNKQSKPQSAESKLDKPREREREREKEEVEEKKKPLARPAAETDEQWIIGLKAMECYKPINIDTELGKAKAWCSTRPGKQCTRRFFVNWLNRSVDSVRTVSNGPSPAPLPSTADTYGA